LEQGLGIFITFIKRNPFFILNESLYMPWKICLACQQPYAG
jgi:hypothetical protein